MKQALVAVALVAMTAPAFAQPAPPPPQNGGLIVNGCPNNIRDAMVAKFQPVAMQCAAVQVPAPTAAEPNKVIQKWAIDVGYKDTHIRVNAAADGTIEDIVCPAAITKAVVQLFGAEPVPLKCMPGDAPRQLRVDVQDKAVVQIQVDGTFADNCGADVKEALAAKFTPATIKCVKLEDPAHVDKLAIVIDGKDLHLTATAKADGTIEDITCPVAIAKAVVDHFGSGPRDAQSPPPAPIKCTTGDMPGQFRVAVPAKAVAQIKLDGTFVSVVAGNDDILESGNWLMALLFWAFAAATIGGALFVITRRNLIAAVMGMVGSFMGIAAIYMMLYAQFLAVIQMLVYAGAIMVLFVFVIMILNRPEDEPIAPSGRAGGAVAIVAILYLVFRLAMLLMHVKAPNGDASLAAPAPYPIPAPGTGVHDWGSVRAVGTDLFGPGLFPFETISILLLIAVVGAIAIARPLKDDEP